MSFRQSLALFIHHQLTVIEIRHLQPQRAIQQDLPRRRSQQIRASNHFRDSHRRIVHHYRKLICRNVVPPPHREISKIPSRHETLPSQVAVHKLDHLSIRHPESPIRSRRKLRIQLPLSARPRIDRLIIHIVRSPGRVRQIFPRTHARINHSTRAQLPPRIQIEVSPFALRVRPKRPSHVRSFLPPYPQPPQIFEHRLHKLRPRPLRIQVLIPEHKRPAGLHHPLIRRPECPPMAQMQISCRRRRHPPAINCCGVFQTGILLNLLKLVAQIYGEAVNVGFP
jgi:hypothetical protein